MQRAMRSGRYATYSEGSYRRLLPLSGQSFQGDVQERCRARQTTILQVHREGGPRKNMETAMRENRRMGETAGDHRETEAQTPGGTAEVPNGNKYMDGNPERPLAEHEEGR